MKIGSVIGFSFIIIFIGFIIFMTAHASDNIYYGFTGEMFFEGSSEVVEFEDADHYDLERYVSIMADVDENILSIDKATKQVIAQLEDYDLSHTPECPNE